jgi:hypothetical protein
MSKSKPAEDACLVLLDEMEAAFADGYLGEAERAGAEIHVARWKGGR